MKIIDDRKSNSVCSFDNLFIGQFFTDLQIGNLYLKTDDSFNHFNAICLSTDTCLIFNLQKQVHPVTVEIHIVKDGDNE